MNYSQHKIIFYQLFNKSQQLVVNCQATVTNILNINLSFKISEDTRSIKKQS